MKKNIAAFVALTVLCLAANAADKNGDPLAPKTFVAPTLKDQTEGKIPEDLRVKRFSLGIEKDQVKEIIAKDDENKLLMDRFDKAKINYKPVVLPLSSMDQVSVHPYFTTSFLLPPGSVISFATVSVTPETLEKDQNILVYRPKGDFDIANLTITYSLNGKNHILVVVVKRFKEDDPIDNQINLIYAYRDIPKLDPKKVILDYVKTYGALPMNDYNYLYIDDVMYRIVKDDKYGNVMIKGNKYRVSNAVIYK